MKYRVKGFLGAPSSFPLPLPFFAAAYAGAAAALDLAAGGVSLALCSSISLSYRSLSA